MGCDNSKLETCQEILNGALGLALSQDWGCAPGVASFLCEGCWNAGMCTRRVFEKDTGIAQGGMLEKAVGMCTRRGFWGGHWNVHQEGCLGRTLGVHQEGCLGRMVGMCTRTGIWAGCWDVHQDGGFGMCGAAAGPCVQRSVLPLAGVGRGGVFDLHHRV